MDTNSMYKAVAGKELYKCIQSEKRQEWEMYTKRQVYRSEDCNDLLTAHTCSIFFRRTCWADHTQKKQDKRETVLFK